MIQIDAAEPELSPFFSPCTSFSKPGAYITHDASQILTAVDAASSGATKGFIPVNTDNM